jgi:phosphate starvation-inducible membrane PsiE
MLVAHSTGVKGLRLVTFFSFFGIISFIVGSIISPFRLPLRGTIVVELVRVIVLGSIATELVSLVEGFAMSTMSRLVVLAQDQVQGLDHLLPLKLGGM